MEISFGEDVQLDDNFSFYFFYVELRVLFVLVKLLHVDIRVC